ALVVAHDHLHRGAAESREALARPQRHLDVVVVVDDVLRRLRGPEILLSEAGEVAGERQHRADQDLGDLRLSRRGTRDAKPGEDGRGEDDETMRNPWHAALQTDADGIGPLVGRYPIKCAERRPGRSPRTSDTRRAPPAGRRPRRETPRGRCG